MSTIKSSTTTSTAYSVTADTTGTLVIQTGATPTTAVTVSSAQVTTLANDAVVNGLTVGRGGGAVATNTAVGASALAANSTGASNTALGNSALSSNNTGGFNTAVGALTLQSNAGAGEYNNAFGWQALKANTTGNENQAFGISAMLSNTTGSNNTAMGSNALRSNTTTSDNTAVGYQAGYNTTAGPNTYVGSGAGKGQTNGYSNVAVGYRNLGYAGGGGSYLNTAVGDYALQNLSTGQSNVAIGYLAAQTHTTGTYGIYIGAEAGKDITTGVGTYIGAVATASANNVTGEMVISAGSNQTGKGGNTGFISPNGGAVYQGNNGATWSVTSDRRIKKNIVDNNIGLEKITAIQVRNFEYRLPEEVTDLPQNQAIVKTGIQLGVIAQELQAVLPECVKTESTGVLSVDADNLTWYMVNAIKELKAEIDLLKGA